ncbi:hypothetical protein FJTKL_13124 [Diaporthe vaccinii]|uniref:Heterokaryon incompatibility domain-containing protein n=1 Tax=Diaporthe vaccinii TaxID=105482 RepID=A0ABR4EBD8_9PEZI
MPTTMDPTDCPAARPLREHTYAPITSRGITRVLILDPARNTSDALSGTLCPLELPSDSAGKTPNRPSRTQRQPYEALSYVWGDPTVTETIRLGGDSVLHLTSSIADALRRVRLPGRTRAVWADQICVDQKDKAERSQQVKLMGSVYRCAERVLVWLGRDPGGKAEEARRLIERLDELFSHDGDADKDESVNYNEALAGFPKVQWIALSELNRLDYTYRLSPNVFLRLYGWFEVGYGLDRPRRQRRFIYNLVDMRFQKASDGRDFVYALLGHWTANVEGASGADGEVGKIVEVDYTKTKAEVYREVAIATLQGHGDSSHPQDLFTLNTVQHWPGWDCPRSLEEFPSWVTQWDNGARQKIVVPLYHTFSASRHRTPSKMGFSTDGRVLTLRGVIVDTIKSVSGEFPANKFRNVNFAAEGVQQRHAAAAQLLFQPWRDLCGSGGRLDSRIEYRPAVEDGAIRTVGRANASALWAYMETVSGMLFGRKNRVRKDRDTRAAHMAAYLAGAFRHRVRADDDATIFELAKKGDAEFFTASVYRIARSKCFSTTMRRGLYVLAPNAVKEGDVLCVLFGGATPYILRRHGSSWLLVGECFVHGMMFGEGIEMLERGEVEEMSFDIE